MEENKKDILINVKVNNEEALSSTEALKKKYKELTQQAQDFDKIDYNNSSVGELKKHLEQATTNLKELKKSGLATEQQLSDMGKTVSKLKDTVSGMKMERAFKAVESSIMGVVGTGQLLTGAMQTLGIESESTEKAIAKMMALMSIKDGIEGLGKYATGMKELMGATEGATGATKLLKIGFASLGIGLLITAVMYLSQNWETVTNTVKQFIPQISGVSKIFTNIVPILEGVGKAVIGFVVRPIGSAIEAFQKLRNGDWKGAGKAIIDALNPIKAFNNVLKDFKSGMSEGIVRKDAEENIKKTNQSIENQIKILEKQGGKEKEIHQLRLKMWNNEISQLKKKNQTLTSADKARIEEIKQLMQEENAGHSKFLTDASAKVSANVEKNLDDIKKYIQDAIKVVGDATRTERQRELNDLDIFYAEQLEKIKKANGDTSKLLEAKKIKEAEINKKYDKEDKEKALSNTQQKNETNLLNATTGVDDKSLTGINKISQLRLDNLKSEYEAERLLYTDQKDKLELLEAKYNNNVYNNRKELADKTKELDKEANQKAFDKIISGANNDFTNADTETLKNDDGEKLAGIQRMHDATLQLLSTQYEAERTLFKDNKDRLAEIEAQYNNEVQALNKDTQDKKDALRESDLQAVSGALGALSGLVQENSAMNKALATSSAIIDTYVGANKAIAQGGFFGIATATAVIATGLANVKKIMSTKVPNEKGVSANISAPIINTTQLQPRQQTQDVRVIDNKTVNKIEVKAVVQNRDLNKREQDNKYYDSISSI
ncbi:hypothetical protein GEO21_21680 [Sphingobacterium faecium]|uniref:hypothetical protein n=1 Tax=Sphingobacterium faecium TaxID=34087 RepID=UPI001290CDDD|nr:hypothetical protein [Sphingobacterium faecium]MQP30097.1 hypothetical protein [Sphingobacterium faecium]